MTASDTLYAAVLARAGERCDCAPEAPDAQISLFDFDAA